MQKLYKVKTDKRGRCTCGHLVLHGKCYYIFDLVKKAYTFCEECGRGKGLEKWWGNREPLLVEEMGGVWFGGRDVEVVVCEQRKMLSKKSENSLKREETLEKAVFV